jgi:hypothetical protein
MNTTGQGITSTWNERMRLIRLRRKKERPRFRDELAIIPRWLIWLMVTLFVIAEIIGVAINLSGVANEGQMWPLPGQPLVDALAIGGLIALVAVFVAAYVFSLGYIYRDAKRRGMHAGLWTLLVLILSAAYLLVGYIIYFLVREPLPYSCPKCGNLVGPRFNFCPNCKCNLFPSCPNCRREIAETDKFCPYCAQELKSVPESNEPVTSQG